MNYFKDNNNEIFAYDDEQVKQGYGKDLEEVVNPIKEDGTVHIDHQNIDKLQLKEDGSHYTYYLQDGTPDLNKIAEDDLIQATNDWKASRQTAVDNIEVTYNGVVYQGDEESQTRMDRTARGLEKKDILYPETAPHTIGWIAKDNSEVQLTADELTLIMIMAGEQQSAIWNEGRPS